ncbi:MAG: SDR family oxidoreductase [Planctomycetes bacterium]|nr:SDR family oxidoreductase [Planctomycetota bacterium]
MATHVVIGATGGIGSSLTRRLAATGHRVVAGARDERRLAALTEEVPTAIPYRLDAASFDEVADCLAAARELGGEDLEGVALCVGSILLRPAHATTFADWQDTITRNLTTAFAVVRAAGKTMRSGGSVVLCSSTAAAVGLVNHEAIAAAKAGVEGLVRAAAASHARFGLRFNAVAPGLVRTPLAAAIVDNPAALQASEQMHPLGRIGEPGEVADAIAWLLGRESAWMTGEVLRLDGGMAHVWPPPR